jgi:uncharacterized protein with von Willebrand factor type A (vWA) domain
MTRRAPRSGKGRGPRGRRAAADHRTPRRQFLVPPNQACWVESDSYDRGTFARLSDESASLRETIDAGAALLPRFAALVEDLFGLCFKNTVVFRDAAMVAPSAHPNRPLLDALATSPALGALRQHTVLDETRAGLGALLLAEELLAQLRNQRLWTREDLRDLWDLLAQENETREKIEAYDVATELASDQESDREEQAPSNPSSAGAAESSARARVSPAASARAADAARGFEHDADLAEARLRQRVRRLVERAGATAPEPIKRAELSAIRTAQELADTGEEGTTAWGLGLGGGRRGSAAAQLELGRRLTRNPKLKRLAQMVGRMRESAFRLRKRNFERVNQETYAVERGAAIARLLPQELVGIRHPILRRDFQRRLIEGTLQVYELRGIEEKGRGPMVVCLDGSSSMAGDKELWAKAVALTLLEIARRQRRLFRFLCFSSADQPLWSLDLNPGSRYEIDERKVYDLAEYFPGGGTDFEVPLNAAVECLAAARYKRGDIVLITDGECRVSSEWLTRFRADKARHGFFVFSVLIDVGTSVLETVREFSDKITSVGQLTDDAARELFLTI